MRKYLKTIVIYIFTLYLKVWGTVITASHKQFVVLSNIMLFDLICDMY